MFLVPNSKRNSFLKFLFGGNIGNCQILLDPCRCVENILGKLRREKNYLNHVYKVSYNAKSFTQQKEEIINTNWLFFIAWWSNSREVVNIREPLLSFIQQIKTLNLSIRTNASNNFTVYFLPQVIRIYD